MEPRPGCEEEPAPKRAREPVRTAAPEGRGERPSRTEKDGGESPGGDGPRDDSDRPRVRGGEGAPAPKKTVRFREASGEEPPPERAGEEPSLFPDYAPEEWSGVAFDKLFQEEDWQRLTDDRLLCKKVLEPAAPGAPRPVWGQQATVKMQAVLEDRTVVEKDRKLLFTIGEGDVSQALEEGVMSMRGGETALLLADSRYAYGPAGREPDVPAGAPLLYRLQLLDVSDKADPLNLPLSDRIRAGNRKRERGNFHFQREEYGMAARAYRMALDVLTTCGGGSASRHASVGAGVKAVGTALAFPRPPRERAGAPVAADEAPASVRSTRRCGLIDEAPQSERREQIPSRPSRVWRPISSDARRDPAKAERCRRGGRARGAPLPGQVSEQPRRGAAQTGAAPGGAARQPRRAGPRARQRQGPLQGGKDPVGRQRLRGGRAAAEESLEAGAQRQGHPRRAFQAGEEAVGRRGRTRWRSEGRRDVGRRRRAFFPPLQTNIAHLVEADGGSSAGGAGRLGGIAHPPCKELNNRASSLAYASFFCHRLQTRSFSGTSAHLLAGTVHICTQANNGGTENGRS